MEEEEEEEERAWLEMDVRGVVWLACGLWAYI